MTFPECDLCSHVLRAEIVCKLSGYNWYLSSFVLFSGLAFQELSCSSWGIVQDPCTFLHLQWTICLAFFFLVLVNSKAKAFNFSLSGAEGWKNSTCTALSVSLPPLLSTNLLLAFIRAEHLGTLLGLTAWVIGSFWPQSFPHFECCCCNFVFTCLFSLVSCSKVEE